MAGNELTAGRPVRLPHDLCAIVLGTPGEGMRLSSFDLDYRAIARHAACQFFRAGHRHIAIALPEPMLGGDEEAARGAVDAVDSMNQVNLSTSVVRCSGGALAQGEQLRTILQRDKRPTAIIIRHLADGLLVYQIARQLGLSIPDDLAVVALNDNWEMGYLDPPLAAYRHNHQLFANRLGRAVTRLMDPCVRKPFHIRLTAELVRRGSVATNEYRPVGGQT